jgi:hypothetical protein
LLFTAEDTAYASGIIICQNFFESNYTTFPMVSGSAMANFAANSASKGLPYCVIAIGTKAATALLDQDASLHEYSDFSTWNSQAAGPGFIACATTDGQTNYTHANQYAMAAHQAGW